MKIRAPLSAAVLLATAAGLLSGHVPLRFNGKNLKWKNPGNVGIVINDLGSDDVADDSDEVALRLAIAEWNGLPGTNLVLIEDTDPAQQARTDWQTNGLHLIMFDETGASGMFGPGTVAVTPIAFQSDGDIVDADVLFNGRDFNFTASAGPGSFDIRDVATHELGHLAGLDHSPWAGSTMYPYVDPLVVLHRSIAEDELRGMRHLYGNATFGRISGSIRRASDNSAVRGAHVVARDAATGRTAGAILTANDGSFTIQGLDPGTYQVFTTPLGNGSFGDAPVDAGNIAGHTIETDFESDLYPSTVTIIGNESVAAGTLLVDADVTLNLGTNIDRFPVRIVAGTSQTLTLRGSGLVNSSALTASDPDLIVGTPMWFNSSVSFQLTVPPGETPGHVDLMVVNPSGQRSILTGGLEVTPASPIVLDVSPSSGAAAGGDALTITGAGFNPGARVVIGDQIYEDGVDATSVVNTTTITLTTTPTATGTHDVVVIDATGVEGRDVDAYAVSPLPVVSQVFPEAGASAGGTEVVLSGADFVSGAQIRIDGVDQGSVTFVDSNTLSFTTQVGNAGLRLLEVENPGGAIATSAFTYETQPDPVLAALSMPSVLKNGGQALTLSGSNFTADTAVEFDADPATGLDGVPAASVTFVDATTLEVVTPAFAFTGPTTVLVRDQSSSQADVLVGALTVKKKKSGGGGCYTVPAPPPASPRDVLLGGWWVLLILAVTSWRARGASTALVRS